MSRIKPYIVVVLLATLLPVLLLAASRSNDLRKLASDVHIGLGIRLGTSKPVSAVALAQLGFHALGQDEFALIRNKTGDALDAPVTQTILLPSGKKINVETDKKMSIMALDGEKTKTFIKAEEGGVEVYKKNEAPPQNSVAKDGKIEPALMGVLHAKDDTVPVIIKLNLPFAQFFGANQSQGAISDKRTRFNQVKQTVSDLFSKKARLKSDLAIIGAVAADVDIETLAALQKSTNVKRVELDKPVKALLDTSVDQIRAREVWGLSDQAGNPLTGKGEKIGILDTGVDYAHPDLGGCLGASCKVIGGRDFINSDNDPMDDNGHGTHVAATAAGKGLLNGVAPDASIVAVKVLDANGSGAFSTVIRGIDYVTDPNGDGDTSDHLDVASMSLGGPGDPDDSVSQAVDNSVAAGVVFTVAAGNSGPASSTIQSPGTARDAITVAASCKTAQIGNLSTCPGPIADFSSRGPLIFNGVDLQKPDVSAPGVLICAARYDSSFPGVPTCFDDAHMRISGTSMATPHVAGFAAILRQAYPNFSPQQIKQLMKGTARNLGMSSDAAGAGEIDVKEAVPDSSALSLVPATWTITSDPTIAMSTHTQDFSLTAKDNLAHNVTISFDMNTPGVSIIASPNSVELTNGHSGVSTVTLSLDNNQGKAGTYVGRILFKESDVIKGSLPIILTVKPTFTVLPTSIDYGVDNPSQTSWTSDTKTVTITNMRTDIPQTLSLGSSTFPGGISLQAPSSITVPANGSSTVETKFVVDNSTLGNSVYTGALTISSGADAKIVGIQFTKFYVLIVKDDSSELKGNNLVFVHNRRDTQFVDATKNALRTFYLNEQGNYDILVWYFGLFDPELHFAHDFWVFRENVPISEGVTTLTLSKSEAKNYFRIIPTDVSNQPGAVSYNNQEIRFLPNGNPVSLYFTVLGGGADYLGTASYSNVSSDYRVRTLLHTIQPAPSVYHYFGTFTGLSESKTITNTPADLKKLYLRWDVDAQSGNVVPQIFHSQGWWYEVLTRNGSSLPLPLSQTVYSLVPTDAINFYAGLTQDSGGSMSPVFSVGAPSKRWLQDFFYRILAPLPAYREPAQYIATGPSFWVGTFENIPNRILLKSYFYKFLDEVILNRYPAFIQQDYSTKYYPQLPFGIYKDDALIYSGTIPEFNAFYGSGRVFPILLDTPGVYEFRTDLPYTTRSIAMHGNVVAHFDTRLADPNPPAITMFHMTSYGSTSDVYDPSVDNAIEAEFDPVGGSLSQVNMEFSQDGTNFQPLTVSKVGETYSAVLPSGVSSEKMTVVLKTTDDGGNFLRYAFDIPQGKAPPSFFPVSPTPTPTSMPALSATLHSNLVPDTFWFPEVCLVLCNTQDNRCWLDQDENGTIHNCVNHQARAQFPKSSKQAQLQGIAIKHFMYGGLVYDTTPSPVGVGAWDPCSVNWKQNGGQVQTDNTAYCYLWDANPEGGWTTGERHLDAHIEAEVNPSVPTPTKVPTLTPSPIPSSTPPPTPTSTPNPTVTPTPTLISTATPTLTPTPRIVQVPIPSGIGDKQWNTPDAPLVVTVGDTIHFINEDDDSSPHLIHVGPKGPCPHQPLNVNGHLYMYKGDYYDCVTTKPYTGVFGDHVYGDRPVFWVTVEDRPAVSTPTQIPTPQPTAPIIPTPTRPFFRRFVCGNGIFRIFLGNRCQARMQ